MHPALTEVITRCGRDRNLTLDEIDQLAASMSLTREMFYDAVLMAVANAFHQGALSFDAGDAVANEFWRLSEFSLSGRAREVFLAFDDGEYHHSRDPEGSDPVQLHTRPQIAEILREESGRSGDRKHNC